MVTTFVQGDVEISLSYLDALYARIDQGEVPSIAVLNKLAVIASMLVAELANELGMTAEECWRGRAQVFTWIDAPTPRREIAEQIP